MRFFLILTGFLLTLGGCSSSWQTDYAGVVNADVARSWTVTDVNVVVPETLTVSEENSFAPQADIVWQEVPSGDRYEQVAEIMRDAALRGVSGLSGDREVHLELEVVTFHALTELARVTLANSGVHNIQFIARILDAESGTQLTPDELVLADLPAFTGEESTRARAEGQTQQVRITDHVARVIDGWLGTGPDMRGSFYRPGR